MHDHMKHEAGTAKATERARKAALSRKPRVKGQTQFDPRTADFDYTPDEVEFSMAMDAYRRRTGVKFPTYHEILQVIRDLGYQKIGLQA